MFFVLFLFGSWGGGVGCISIHEKDRGLRQHTIHVIAGGGRRWGGGRISIHEKDKGLRQHTIYVLVYYISFFHFLQL